MVIWNHTGEWFYHTICHEKLFILISNGMGFVWLAIKPFWCIEEIATASLVSHHNWHLHHSKPYLRIYGHLQTSLGAMISCETLLYKFDIILAYLPPDLLQRQDQSSVQVWLQHPQLSLLHCLSERYPPHQSHLLFPPSMHIYKWRYTCNQSIKEQNSTKTEIRPTHRDMEKQCARMSKRKKGLI